MKTTTSLLATSLICLCSCGPENVNEPKPGTSTSAKPVEAAQKPASLSPKLAAEGVKVEVPTLATSTEETQKIMHKRKSSDFESASKQFGELLQQSSIIGKPITEVKALLGRPDEETDTSIAYRFEAGFGGWDWVLEHDGKNVLSFSRKGVN